MDRSLRVHLIESGEQCMNSIDELDCDHLDSCEDYVLTRCMEGSSIVVWKSYSGKLDLEFLDEIDLSEQKSQLGEILQFKMQGKILTRFSNNQNDTQYDLVLLVTVIDEGILINALMHKPLSEI